MTSAQHLPSRPSRRRTQPSDRRRQAAVTVVDGVKMSCQELSNDLALIRFVCPPPRKQRARGSARET